jgi:hypothetical protein
LADHEGVVEEIPVRRQRREIDLLKNAAEKHRLRHCEERFLRRGNLEVMT